MFKRSFDIFLSAAGLLLLSPFLTIIVCFILIDSKGPLIYTQIRAGKNNNDFKLFKFRTMYVNSDKMGLLTVGNRDSRITKAGYWIRKYKIDEFPQLVNVLIGDMSFVGPRPEVRKYVQLYTDCQLKVLKVKPGITDWASIKYINESELLLESDDAENMYIQKIMPLKLELNIQYINEASIITDFKIICLTIKKIFLK